MRHDIAQNSTKFSISNISSKFILQILSVNIFHNKVQNVCHANCSRVVSSFAIPSGLRAPTALNQMGFVGNLIIGKFYSIYPRLSKKASVLVLSTKKKRFYPQFFIEYFYKNIHNLVIKMFYQNRGHIFELYLIGEKKTVKSGQILCLVTKF